MSPKEKKYTERIAVFFTKEQLERLPFLTEQEIEDICVYVYHYAPLKSMGELAMIESLDATKRRLLQCFVYLGEEEKNTEDQRKVYDHHELIATLKVPFHQREGDKCGYLGNRYRHQFRYRYQHGKHRHDQHGRLFAPRRLHRQ